ncbi:aminodeoxychorismate lyase [Photobacterium damselae]|nr:aminodeoxychorismate lyase [Photobacterium damselae]
MAWVNGQQQHSLSISDRATQYGDGCFTTILVIDGQPQLWEFHLQRLQDTLAYFAISAPNWQHITQEVFVLAQKFKEKGGIKILISRGSGGRGYSGQDCSQTQVIITTFAWPEHYSQWQQQGICLGVCSQRLGLVPMLAGWKHLNRLEQVLLKQEIENNHWLDGLVLDLNGNITETSVANIFWRKGCKVFTPTLKFAGVHGVMRRKVIELIQTLPYQLEFIDAPIEEIMGAEEVFITNALMSLVPINQIENQTFHKRQLLNALIKGLTAC